MYQKKNSAFTLIEILIVIAIILIMTAVGLDIYSSSRKFMVVDLESDKLIALMRSIREESKALRPAQCVGIEFSVNNTPQKVYSDYNSDARDCGNARTTSPITFGGEAAISAITLNNSSRTNLTLNFAPPFGEMELSETGNTGEITVAFRTNTNVFKKIYFNRMSGNITKL